MNTNSSSQRSRRPSRARSGYLASAISAVLSLAASAAHAGPRDGIVTSGTAAISTPDLDLTQIDQGSHSASIDWQSFDIAAHERVIFNQPSASSVTLNRILTQDPSQIHGSITANGRVFLINPNGIIFGASSRINVGSLVASSLDIADVDAATGRYTFNTTAQRSGAISNSGKIIAAEGGSVTLLGGSVANDGLIVADYGSVNLGAGRAATLHFDGDGLVRFQIDAGLLPDASDTPATVDNTGEILADGGQVLLTARAASDVIARAVNNDGVIRAARVENVGGVIRLLGAEGTVVNNGTLDAAGVGATSTGGNVQVLGDRVELSGTALVDVSGSAGGGTALIGGSFRGNDPAVLNARQTDVHAGAAIRADATASGDAGQVAVWADGTTTFHGDIFARAAGQDGNGGTAEVSGKEHLRIGGHAWLESVNGTAGTLLLDPGSILIKDGPNAASTGAHDVINDGWIIAQLGSANVAIATSDSSNNGSQDLVVDGTANITWANSTSLTLTGDNSVSLLAGSNITNTGTGALILQSNGTVAIGGTVSVTGGLTIAADDGITQTAALSVGGAASFTADAGQSIVLNSSGNVFGGTVNFVANGPGNLQNVTVHDSTALDLQALALDGNLNASATVLTQSGALNISGTSSFTAADGQSIVLANSGNAFGGAVSFASGGTLQNITVQSSTALDLQALAIDGDLAVNAQSITQSGALIVAGTSSFTADETESVVLGDTGNSLMGAVSFASRGAGNLQNVTLSDITALDLQALGIAGNLTVNAQSITQSGALSIGGAASFTAANGQSITLGNTGNSFGGTVNFASGGTLQDVTVHDVTALNLQALGISGNLAVNAQGITQSGALDIGGTSSFTAAGGQSIVLDNVGNSFGNTVNFASGGMLQNVTVHDSTDLDLQALAINGNLAVTARAITQSGALVVGGTSSFAALAGESIALNNAGNSFGGAVSLAANGSGNLQDVTLRDATALDLQALTVDGDLNIIAGAAVSQSGALNVAGAASFRTLNNAGAAITLDGINSFGSVQAAVRTAADTANAAASIVIHENDATVLGDMQTATGQSVSVVSAGAIAALASTSITTSSVSLTASGDIGSTAAPISLGTANGHISAGSGGSIYLTNVSGASVVALDQIVAGGTGAVELVSDGDIRVSDVRAGTAISLSSTGGSIVDDNVDGAGSQLVTGNLTLLAAGAIGQAAGVGNGTLDLQAGSVGATAHAGGIYLDEAGGDIGIRQISATGPIEIQAAAGSILDDSADASVASITSTTGGIQLRARDNVGTVTDVRTRRGAPIAIHTNGALSAQVTSATGQVNLELAAGTHPTAGAAAIAAGGSGRLLIQSAGDLSLNSFNAAISGFSEAGFSSDGILQLSAQQSDLIAGPLAILFLRGGNDIVHTDRVFDLSAAHLIFESGAQGGSVTLNTHVGRLDAAIGNAANLTVVDGGASDLMLGSITAGGDVSIRAAHLVDDGDTNGVTRITAGNTLSLLASAGIGGEEGVAGGRIDTAANSVSVIADAGPIFISHLGDLQVSGEARAGLIDIATPTGSITVDGVLAASGPLTLTAGADAAGAAAVVGNITLRGAVRSEGALALSALGGGAIADADDSTTHLSARDATLTGTVIGSASNRFNIDVASLTASAADGLYLNVTNAVQLRTIAAHDVVISAAGNITDDGDAQTRITAGDLTLSAAAIGAAGAGNEIDTAIDRLTATTSAGGIYVGELGSIELAAVSANGAGNDVTISASEAMTDDGDSMTRIDGGNLTLAARTLGAADVGGELDTGVTSLTASASGGGIFIAETDNLQLNAVTAATGSDVVLSAGGVLTDDGNDATRVAGEHVALTGSALGVANSRLDAAAAVLSATATNGGIYLDEQDAVTLADIHSSGSGNQVDLRTGNNGSIIVQNLTTEGGAVTLAANGTGSLTVTGAIASNNGVVNLTAGDALAVPGLDTGTGTVVLHTVNDLNVGSITAGSIAITSDTGNICLGTINAGTGTASITADNGTISDGTTTSLTAGQATLSARSIGSEDNPLNVALGSLTATTSAGGLFLDAADGLTVAGIGSAGRVKLATAGSFLQTGAITSAGNAISVVADSIDMLAAATTDSTGGDITYIANSGDASLTELNAGTGRALLIVADNVFSALDANSTTSNITASAVEIRAGGMGSGPGDIGTDSNPLSIATSGDAVRSVFLVVPLMNGVQTSTPRINYAGSSASILLKGYSGSSGALLFDQASAFTSDTVLGVGESIVPLLNGRIAINNDSLRAARQALSSGVINAVSVDWAAFDPDVSLFGTLDPPLRLPADQVDEAGTGL